MRIPYQFLAWVCAGAFLAIAPAMRADDQIRTYSVPKEQPDATAADGAMPASDIPLADFKSAPIQWTTPGDWTTLAPTTIRIGNFVVEKGGKKADITVVTFPGSVGSELDNVNRWRQQVGLAPAQPDEIVSKSAVVDGGEGKLYDISGATDRILVASVPRDGNTWFFKMHGDKDLVADEQPEFLDFLKSVRFNAGATQSQSAPPIASDVSADPNAGASPAPDPHAGLGLNTTESSSDMPKWNVPSTWEDKAPGPMILKSFSVSDGHASAATVSISVFPGEVGGVLANVNRWRGQLGLGPVESDDLSKVIQPIDAGGGKAVLVDFTGSDKTGQPARLIAAIVPHGSSTWFYKILGAGPLVEREKKNFVNFVQTVQYP